MWGLEPQSKGPTEPMCDPSPGLEHMLRTAQQFLVACADYYKRGAHINLHGKRLREALGKQLTADSMAEAQPLLSAWKGVARKRSDHRAKVFQAGPYR